MRPKFLSSAFLRFSFPLLLLMPVCARADWENGLRDGIHRFLIRAFLVCLTLFLIGLAVNRRFTLRFTGWVIWVIAVPALCFLIALLQEPLELGTIRHHLDYVFWTVMSVAYLFGYPLLLYRHKRSERR